MSLLVTLGNDKLRGMAVSQLGEQYHFDLLIDRSSSYKRVLRLVAKGILSLSLLNRIFLAERKTSRQRAQYNYQ